MRSPSRIDAIAAGSLAAFWAVLVSASGAISAGFHLVDDHEIVRITAELRTAPAWAVVSHWVRDDLGWRFRPFYFVHRVAEAVLFRDHFLAWSIYTSVLALACAVLLYAALRTIRFSPAEAWAFAFFALVGEQGAIWWRLGPNETPGMVLLAAAALALARHARTGSRAARTSFVAAVVLASLSKESFILLIPAILFAHAWAWRAETGASWIQAARRVLPETAVLLTVMVAELVFIKLRVGTEGIGYAGVAGLTVEKALVTAQSIARFGELWWVIVALAAVGAILGGPLRLSRAALPAALLIVATVLPQGVLYAKSGVGERYFLPGVLGPAFALAASLRYLRTLPDRAIVPAAGRPARLLEWFRATVTARRAALVAAGVALASIAATQTRTAWVNARRFATEGDQAFVERLAASGGPVLVAGGLVGVYEYFWSLQWYFDGKAQRHDVYFQFIAHEPRTEFDDRCVKGYETNAFFRKRDPAAGTVSYATIGLLAGTESAFVANESKWFDPAAYTRQVLGSRGFVIYARRQQSVGRHGAIE